MNLQSILITGASSGIGKTCALHLDQLGFQVFAGVRSEADADKLATQGSENLTPIHLDVVDDKSITSAVKLVSRAVGEKGLMGLVNNAGIVSAGPMEFLALEEIRRVLEVNLFGQIAVTQAFLPVLRKNSGRIVNMSSISGVIASPFAGPYTISKFALESFSDVLRRELIPWDIHVAIIEPGRINTPIWEKSLIVVENIIEHLPPPAHKFYGKSVKRSIGATLKSKQPGASPEAVARAVAHALTARKPKLRYPVGIDAQWVTRLFRYLPARWIDAFLAKQRGFEKIEY